MINMYDVYMGVDNGVSGTIGIIDTVSKKVEFIKTPVKKPEQDYTKKKSNITRLDFLRFKTLLELYKDTKILIIFERPMINNTRFIASKTGLRCWEAQLICVEILCLPYIILDSKEWQKKMLPKGISKEELKTASLQISNKIFPQFKDFKHPDRDGLLIAEYQRRLELGYWK